MAHYQTDRVYQLTPPTAPQTISFAASSQQSGLAGQSVPITLTVTDGVGRPIPQAPVTFEANPPDAASFAPVTVMTDQTGKASTIATLGWSAGSVVITARVLGLAAASLPLTIQAGAQIANNGIAGAGLSSPPVTALSPNGLVSIFGTGFAPAGTSKQVGQADLVNGLLPTNLSGTCVLIGSSHAYMLYVSPNQINLQVPDLMGSTANLQVVRNCGTSEQAPSAPISISLQAATPEFFYLSHHTSGTNQVAAFDAVTGVAIGTSNPARSGDIISLYGTGFGLTNPMVNAGVLPRPPLSLANPIHISIGEVELDPSDVLYSGLSSFAGVYQLNIRVPSKVPAGNQPIVVTLAGIASPPNAVIAISSR
ncbi:MAG TPA: Ig-like domain-containing protein [Bryobacteraceae bacterium]|nr:Ig-like domain-containing protein [Bryobacteraceae bacterium]